MHPISQEKPISVSVAEGIFSFHPQEIVRLEARSNYTFIYFTNRRPLVAARVLKKFEDMLSGYGFVRTHRKHLVNTACVTNITDAMQVELQDATCINISRRKKKNLLSSMAAA